MNNIFNFLNNILSYIAAALNTFEIKDIIDIGIVTFLVYQILKLVRDTRALQLIKGILILSLVYLMSYSFKFTTLSYIMKTFFEFSVLVLFIVFQPEIRRILEQIGRSNIPGKKFKIVSSSKNTPKDILETCKTIEIMVDTACILSNTKTGALIVFERETKLGDIVKKSSKSTVIDAKPTCTLVRNIFFNKAPLHDGAMIIKDNRIYAAACVLPLPTNEDNIDPNLGTRHRAAIGVSEVSDAVVLVVSEETGKISLVYNGKLQSGHNRESLKEGLEKLLLPENMSKEKNSDSSFFLKRGNINEKIRETIKKKVFTNRKDE